MAPPIIGSISVLSVLMLTISEVAQSTDQNLSFMFITSFGRFGLNSSGAIPAADIALEAINDNPNILPGYNLVYHHYRDSECQHIRSLDDFFLDIQMDPVEIAVIGCGCTVATEPVAEISHRWNIPQLSYASELSPLSERTAFDGFYQNSPSFAAAIESLNSLMQHFQWKRIALFTEDELRFTRAELVFRRELEPENITVASHLFETLDDPLGTIEDLFFEENDYRVFLFNCYSEPARQILCKAAKRGLRYPKYTWIIYDWFPEGWWKSRDTDTLICSEEEMKTVLERAISFRRHPVLKEGNTTTDAGISPIEFHQKYTAKANAENHSVIDAGYVIFDALWILALALNNTMYMMNTNDISNTDCGNVPGSLENLENFNYKNRKMGCVIRWNLNNTNFSGVSGHISYDINRTRIENSVILRQYIVNESGSLIRQTFASLNRNDDYIFTYLQGFNDNIIFPDGITLDGTILNITHTFELGLVIVFDILATMGLIFTIGCLMFNIIFRNRKIVKISSPSLNYFIILGAFLMYSSIYFFLFPSLNHVVVLTGCLLELWLFTVGYSLAYGAVLAKMWRVYQIFSNPKPKKRVMKDWQLIIATLILTGISVVLLTLEVAVPQLRGMVYVEEDGERAYGTTEDLEIREHFFVLVCYDSASLSFFWRILIYIYLGILQLLGIVLSFQTRRIKYTGLRDSKYITAIIYISSIVLAVLALVTFSLRTYINIGTGIFVSGYLILTTVFLSLIFIPKMVLLYKDPKGESITEPTMTPSTFNVSTKENVLQLNNLSLRTKPGNDNKQCQVETSPN